MLCVGVKKVAGNDNWPEKGWALWLECSHALPVVSLAIAKPIKKKELPKASESERPRAARGM